MVSPGTLVQLRTVITTSTTSARSSSISRSRDLFSASWPWVNASARSSAYPKQLDSVVTSLDSRVDPISPGHHGARQLPNPERLLKPGHAASVEVLNRPRVSLTVPSLGLGL